MEIDNAKMRKALALMAEARKIAHDNPKRADVLRAQADKLFDELDREIEQAREAVTG